MSPGYPNRTHVIPIAAWIVAGCLFAGLFIGLNLMAARKGMDTPFHLIFTFAALAGGGYALLVGYVYGDAKRRGMRYIMWTLLAIFLSNGIGVPSGPGAETSQPSGISVTPAATSNHNSTRATVAGRGS